MHFHGTLAKSESCCSLTMLFWVLIKRKHGHTYIALPSILLFTVVIRQRWEVRLSPSILYFAAPFALRDCSTYFSLSLLKQWSQMSSFSYISRFPYDCSAGQSVYCYPNCSSKLSPAFPLHCNRDKLLPDDFQWGKYVPLGLQG